MVNYYLMLTKPGILLGNLITVAAGFLLASKGIINFTLFLQTLVGLGLIMASGCVFNNYIDKPLDEKMERTKNRALVRGVISTTQAISFAVLLGVIGNSILWIYTNPLTVAVADFGFFVYVVLYSLWKSKTIYGTAIGSIAGAVPPVVGYCAVSNQLDLGALILFAMMVLWQMPHFFAIAIYHYDDYAAAQIPALPLVKGMYQTKIRMILYILAFMAAAFLLTYFQYTGYAYLAVALVLSAGWLVLGLKGFYAENDRLWGKQMFRWSLVLITAICCVIPFDVIVPTA